MELEPLEFVLQFSNLLEVRLHLWVLASGVFHDLIDNQRGISQYVESLHAQSGSDLEFVDQPIVLRDII